MILEIIKKVNWEIERMYAKFNRDGKENPYLSGKIDGMLEVLEMLTGEKYRYDENGIYLIEK